MLKELSVYTVKQVLTKYAYDASKVLIYKQNDQGIKNLVSADSYIGTLTDDFYADNIVLAFGYDPANKTFELYIK